MAFPAINLNLTSALLSQKDFEFDQNITDLVLSEPELDDSTASSSPAASPNTSGGRSEHLDHMITSFNNFDDIENTTDFEEAADTVASIVGPGQFANEQEIITDPNLSDSQKRNKVSKILAQAASSGADERVRTLLEDAATREWIDVDVTEDDGTTPLIYAGCFGYLEVAKALLRAGANVDAQDQSGWSALMWATTNNHDLLVKLLLDNGASTNKRTATGRTVMQYVKHGFTHEGASNEKLLEVFTSPRSAGLTGVGLAGYNWREDSACFSGDTSSLTNGQDSIQSGIEAEIALRKALANATEMDMDLGFLDYAENEEGEDIDIPIEFDWDTCIPTQMFVFSPSDVKYIVHAMVTNMKPLCSRERRSVPANVLFLAARFAHNFGPLNLVEDLLGSALTEINGLVQQRCHEVPLLAFWMSNCTQLLYYLKKDATLVGATIDYQFSLSELIQDIHVLLVHDVQGRLSEVLEAAMLQHDPIPLEDTRFRRGSLFQFSPEDVINSISIRSAKRSRTMSGGIGKRSLSISRRLSIRRSLGFHTSSTPHSVVALLSSTLFVLQSYEVHPTLIHQVLTQLFYYISAEIFNGILSNPSLCSRSKAMQIRMNLSEIETWVYANHMPTSLLDRLSSTVQLLQLLQCLSRLNNLEAYLETICRLDQLNSLQLARIVRIYRYEIGESNITGDLRRHIDMMAEEEARRALDPTDLFSADDDDDDDTYPIGQPVCFVRDLDCSMREKGASNHYDVQELIDSVHLLPFSVPSNNEMNVCWGKSSGGKDFTPSVPEEFYEQLDANRNQVF